MNDDVYSMVGAEGTRSGDHPSLVLVVDDNDANLALFEQVLSGIDGVGIKCVSDPQVVEQVFVSKRPNLAILDLHAPVLSGTDLQDVLAARAEGDQFLPFLIITGDSVHPQATSGTTNAATTAFDHAEAHEGVDQTMETHRLDLKAELSRLDDAVAERTAELATANANLRNLAHSKDEFLAAVAHELRTPLSAVLGFARELAERVELLSSDEITEIAKIIAEQSTDMAARIDDCLVAARSRINRVVVLSERVDLRSQFDQVIGSMSSEAQSRITRPVSELSALGDPLRVRQILRNLVQNAVIHGGSNISVEQASNPDEGWVEIRVIDDGGGVPDHERPFLFATPLEVSGKRVQQGSIGLGLFVSGYLARLMGGDLNYRPGEPGAVFALRLPGA